MRYQRIIALLWVCLVPLSASAQKRWTAIRVAPKTNPDSVAIRMPAFGVLGPDDRIYMFDNGAILVCDQEGRPIRRIGRQGKGPGEFLNLRSFGFLKDTLWTYDEPLRRVTYFAPSFKVARTEALPEFPKRDGPSFGYVYIQGILTDRSLVAFLWGDANLGVPYVRLRPFSETPRGMIIRDEIGVMKSNAGSLRLPNGTGMSWENPWTSSEEVSVSPDGSRYVTVTYETGKGYTLVSRTPSKLIFRKEFNDKGVEIPRARFKAWLEDTTWHPTDRYVNGNDVFAAAKRAVGDAKFFSPISGLALGNDGTTWVRRESYARRMTAPTDSVRWDIIDPAGTRSGFVYLPARARMIAVRADRIWETEEDENGDIWLVPYKISQ